MGYIKKPDPNTRPVKYFLNKKKGMNKKEASKEAGYKDERGHNTNQVEETKTYQAAETEYAGLLKDKMPFNLVVDEHIKNIRQDKDKGAKQNAMKDYFKHLQTYPSQEGELEIGDVIIKFGKSKE